MVGVEAGRWRRVPPSYRDVGIATEAGGGEDVFSVSGKGGAAQRRLGGVWLTMQPVDDVVTKLWRHFEQSARRS